MLGYTESTIARKAEKRGVSAEDYTKYLINQRKTRTARRKAAKAERLAQAQVGQK